MQSLQIRSLLLVMALSISCQAAPPGTPDIRSLHEGERRGDVMRFAGKAPSRCTWSSPTEEVCSWQLGNRHPAWWALAPTVPTDYQVNLVCAFPVDGSPRGRDTCVVYPRKFMPFKNLPPVATRGGARGRTGVSAESRQSMFLTRKGQAEARLASAGTVWEMSGLVGDVPDHCGPVSEVNQFCSWMLSRQNYGYDTLALLADSDKRVELTCTFPRDGSAREPGTCQAREQR